MTAVRALAVFQQHEKLPLTEKQVDRSLREMYRTLLNGDDYRFRELQQWLADLIDSKAFNDYSDKLQEKMKNCLDQYRIENRYPADSLHPAESQWPYLYYLDSPLGERDISLRKVFDAWRSVT